MEATALNLRQARMEFKTTTGMKDLLSQAAALDGLDLTGGNHLHLAAPDSRK